MPKEETYNKYGDDARKLKLKQWESAEIFYEVLFRNSGSGLLREGRFVYTIKNKPIADGHKNKGIVRRRESEIIREFRVGRLQEFANKNTSTPTIQLQSLMICLAAIAYRRRNFRTMDVSRASFKLKPLVTETYIQLPQEIEKGNVSRKLTEPVSGLGETGSERGQTVRNFLTNGCGGRSTSFDKSVFPRMQKNSNTNAAHVSGAK